MVAALVLVGDHAAPVGGSPGRLLLRAGAAAGSDLLLLVMVSSGPVVSQVVVVLGGGGLGRHGTALLRVGLVEAWDHLQAIRPLDEAVRGGALLDDLGG